ncbi:uncharacterized protein LOC107041820 [Diachasma alloeum]|uniref:uncharacterized protein LOC107041820 n=1 Tax=Diachasma alloeum TaxID=454923 RepID=UPI000738327A|nr:uncharacterized protein LOC107041820 [Diachasma alloeum]
MDDTCETLWRSIDSSFNEIDPSSAEVSFKSLTGSSDDVSGSAPPAAVTPQKCGVSIDEGLVNALRNLQLASVRKPCQFRPPIILSDDKRGLEDAHPGEGDAPVDNFMLECENGSREMKEQVDQPDLQSSIVPDNLQNDINLEMEEFIDLLSKQPSLLFSIIPEDLEIEDESEEMKESIQLVDELENESERSEEVVELSEQVEKLPNPKEMKELTELVDELVELSLLVEQPNVQSSIVPENLHIENNPEDRNEFVELVDELVESLQVEQSNVQSIVSENLQIGNVTSERVESSEETNKSNDLVDLPQQMDPQDPVHPPVSDHNQSLINYKVKPKDSENKKIAETPRAKPAPLSIPPNILDNMKKAVKPLLKPLNTTRKTTIGVSPMLQTKSRCRVTKTSSLTQLNQSTTHNQIKKKTIEQAPLTSSSLKRLPTKNVVATVVSTKEGIQLKEEKISNFGIPVNIARKKKRTQAIPFSFTTRKKDFQHQQERKTQQKLPMRDSNSLNQQKQPLIMRSTTEKKTSVTKPRPVIKSLLSDESMNKENRSINLNKSKTVIGGPKLSTGLNLKERRDFGEKVKQREREIGGMRASIELKKQQKEKIIDSELRKKTESKANAVPVFKIPAPVRSNKPSTIPRK